ncbi:MAG: tetratricopeptide repeat protein [Candidatus Hydrothermarchaeales archaeon]
MVRKPAVSVFAIVMLVSVFVGAASAESGSETIEMRTWKTMTLSYLVIDHYEEPLCLTEFVIDHYETICSSFPRIGGGRTKETCFEKAVYRKEKSDTCFKRPVYRTETREHTTPGYRTQTIKTGDTTVTGKNQRAELSFGDETRVNVGENTKIEVVELKETGSVLKIWWGKVHTFWRGTIEKFRVKHKHEIHTPTSTTGRRGTEYTLEVAEDGTTIVTVFDGAVELSDLAKTKTVVVEQYQTSVVEPGGVPSDPVSIDSNQSDRWWDDTDLANAIKAYDEAIEINPNDTKALYNKGIVLASLGRYAEAIEAYDKALEIDSTLKEAWYGKGVTLLHLDRYEEAIEAYDKALEIDSTLKEAWSNKGRILGELGRYDEAINALDKALEIDPRDVDAWHNKGAALLDLGRYEEAITACNKAIELDPQNEGTWFNKGLALDELGRYEEAIDAYDKALEIDPRDVDAWHNKGLLLARLGRYAEAIDAYDKALEIDPTHEIALQNRELARENLEQPGFEAVLAVVGLATVALAGLLAVAYFVRRRRI